MIKEPKGVCAKTAWRLVLHFLVDPPSDSCVMTVETDAWDSHDGVLSYHGDGRWYHYPLCRLESWTSEAYEEESDG